MLGVRKIASEPKPTVRLIVESAAQDGPTNMARDEILLEQADRYEVATIRWYRWQPATLSLGYFQQDEPAIHSDLPRVRRLSGGGAILHDQEWTYSITAPRGIFADARQLYEEVHSILIDEITRYGCSVAMRGIARPEIDDNFLCFDRGDQNDVIATAGNLAGTKVIGSAQRRRGKAILQHGSVHFADIIYEDRTNGQETQTLDQLVSFEKFCNAVSEQLIAHTKCGKSNANWSSNELRAAKQWAGEKYQHLVWQRDARRGPKNTPQPPRNLL